MHYLFFRSTSPDFSINGYFWILVIDFIVALFLQSESLLIKKDDNANCFIAYFYAFSISIAIWLNDSLIGVFFLSILLFYLIKADGLFGLIFDCYAKMKIGGTKDKNENI